MQNMDVIHGIPALRAKIKIALANQRGPWKTPIKYEIERDEKGKITSCTAYAYDHKGNRDEYRLTKENVLAEKWHEKPGSKWRTSPEKMYRYRAASWLIDTVCPGTCLGMETTDEAREFDAPKIVQDDTNNLNEALSLTAVTDEEPVEGVVVETAQQSIV